jgi:two-component system response regulator (stage 0 sporulation protein A)
MRKVLIVDAAEDFRSVLADALRGTYAVKTCDNGQDALELARTFCPDLLILDLMISGVDGLSLVQMITQIRGKPLVLATTRFQSEYVLDAASRIGIDYMVVKPCNIQAMIARLDDLVASQNRADRVRPDSGATVANTLKTLGVATRNSGYTYLREAVPIFAEDPRQAITKELYPAVGKRCNVSADQVERSIRTAIEGAWNRRDEQIWKLYFTPLSDGSIRKPSNAEFISRLAELLIHRYEQREEY